MNRPFISLVIGILLFTLCYPARAQQPAKIPRIGYLTGTSLSNNSPRQDAFRQGLRELGYIDGKNITIEFRSAEGKLDRLPALATELVRLKVDIIVSGGRGPTLATKKATNTIPIIMTNEGDPVGSGIVASLARPGENITGLSTLAPELSGKRLELLQEIVPKLSRVVVFRTSTQPGNSNDVREVELVAKAFSVRLQHFDVRDPQDIATAFQAALKGQAQAGLMMVAGAVANQRRTEIVNLAVKNRLPVMYQSQRYVEAGGLMAYGVSTADLDRRAATFVDKILKGRKPADLPVEQPIKFEFIVNLKAAKQIGLMIPQWTLMKADKVIR